MDTWATFWGFFLIAVLVVFALLAVAITIGGFRDVKSLFSSMQPNDEESRSGADKK